MLPGRLLRFAIVGSAMTLANLGVLWLLVDRAGWSVPTACTASFFALNAVGYLANKAFTFGLGARPRRAELLRYYAVMALSLAANLALMELLVGAFGLHYLVASLAVTALLALMNFWGHAGFTFRLAGRAGRPGTRLRVLQVSAFFPSHGGGIEVVAGRLADGLASAGDVELHWLASACDTPPPVPAGSAARYVALPSRDPLERRIGLPMPIWGLRGLWQLWRAVGWCDLVHVHDYLYQPTLAAVLFAALRGRPYVVTQHIGAITFASARATRLLERLNRRLGSRVLGAAARAVFVGSPVMAYFRAFTRFESEPRLVPNGVDLDGFRPRADGAARDPSAPVKLLFVGRFVEKKGLPLLRRCLDLPGVHWTFVGWGPLPPVEASTPAVALAGRQPPAQVAAFHAHADLLVLPSTGEGFPLVVQEALASGTPVLVSREVAEAFPQTDPGCVFDVELRGAVDPAALLRDTLLALTADRERLARARPLARALAGQWSWPGCVRAYRALYREATGR